MSFWTAIIAQASQPTPVPQSPMAAPDSFFRFFLPLIVVMILMVWWSSRSQRKERDKYQQMLNSLKRNDRVQTVGGVFGTVVDVKDNEIILKIDEASNVKMRVHRGSIKEIYRDQAAAEPAKS